MAGHGFNPLLKFVSASLSVFSALSLTACGPNFRASLPLNAGQAVNPTGALSEFRPVDPGSLGQKIAKAVSEADKRCELKKLQSKNTLKGTDASKIGGKVVEENQERGADQAARREIADIIDHAIEMQKQAIRVELGQLANKSPAPSAESIESKIASYKDACGPKGELAILKSRLNCRPLVVNTTCNVPTNGDLRSFMECVVPADLLRSAGKDNQSPTLLICDP